MKGKFGTKKSQNFKQIKAVFFNFILFIYYFLFLMDIFEIYDWKFAILIIFEN